MHILGIDIGSKSFAFAFIKDGRYIKSWVSDFLGNDNVYTLTHDAVLEALSIWERENLIDKHEDFVAFEKINLTFGNTALLIELVGILKLTLAQRDIMFDEVSATTVKKHITGNGHLPKKDKKIIMLDKINSMFNLNLTDHNESDSIAIAYTSWLLEKE